jgi:tetratricopeptide (TPR) repeat protein
MAAETKNMGIEEPYFFSTHPRMVERVASLNAILEVIPPANGEVNAAIFQLKTTEVRVVSLAEDISMHRYKSVIMLLEKADLSSSGYPEYCNYYLGEAYRQRGDDGDEERAFLAYREAINAAPEFAPTYRALGLYYLKQKDFENARQFFGAYLQRDPDAIDREYIRFYIETLEKREGS